jgi:hypothetical protein
MFMNSPQIGHINVAQRAAEDNLAWKSSPTEPWNEANCHAC